MEPLKKASGGERTAQFWDREHWKEVPLDYWASNPIIQSYINRRTTGDPNLRWLDWFKGRYVPQSLDCGLCLACGAGTAEIHAVSIDLCRRMDACDISEKSLASARARAESYGVASRIGYQRCDLNEARLDPGTYDVVLSSGGLHHIRNIEHLLAEVKASLRPGGFLAVDEYVGPCHLQYTDRQLEIVRQVVGALPEALRTRRPVVRPDLQFMMDTDPSEAVRSAELLTLLSRDFEILEVRPYGGTLMNVLYGSGAIDPRLLLPSAEASPGTPAYADLLPPILLLEESLNDCGALPNDYAVIVARPWPGC